MNAKIVPYLLMGITLMWMGLHAQTQPAPAKAAPKAAAAPSTSATPPAAKKAGSSAKAAAKASPVESVIQLVKSGVKDTLIIKTLKAQNKAVVLSPEDLLKLQGAGVSEAVIETLMDPSAVQPAATAAAPPAPTADTAAAPPPPPAPPASAEPAKPAPVAQAQKIRVIVDEFDYSAVLTAVNQVFQTNANIGKGIRAMLVKRVAEQKQLVVVERAKIDTLQAEQDRNASNRVKQGTGARIGRITGANAMLSGDIIIFGRDDKQMKVNGGGIAGRAFGAFGAARREDKAVVAINYRLIDAETSEIIATGEARGESSRKSKGFGAMAGAFGKAAGGVEVDMTSSGFAETIIGEATVDCVNKLAAILGEQTANMKQTAREVEALVADVNGASLTISAGSGDGVNQGEVFEIHKILREVKDPVTKETLDRVTDKVGEMTITTVRDRVAIGRYAGAAVQVGFIARKKI